MSRYSVYPVVATVQSPSTKTWYPDAIKLRDDTIKRQVGPFPIPPTYICPPSQEFDPSIREGYNKRFYQAMTAWAEKLNTPVCRCTASLLYYEKRNGIPHNCPSTPSISKSISEPLTTSCAAVISTNSSSSATASIASAVASPLTTSIPDPSQIAFDELVEVCKRRDQIWSRGGGDISIGDAEELARKQLKKEKAAAVKEAKRIIRETPVVVDGVEKRKVTPTMKRKVAASQDYRCALCKAGPLADYDIDHKIPLSKGGLNDIENLQMLCVSCHRFKTSIERTK